MATLFVLGALGVPSRPVSAQHLRIFACAIANDSAGAFMGGSSNGSGLYQSDDTGRTWKHLGWDNIKCYSMDAVDSSNGRILYEATGLGILRSTDYGAHWKQLTDWRIAEAMDVAVNQKNPNEIYIATAHGPWRTEDGGKTWKQLLDGLPLPYCSRIVIDSVIDSHVILGAESGMFTLVADSLWEPIPCKERDIKNHIEKNATGIRDILQFSKNEWRAASENSRMLISHDNATTFGTMSYGREGLWCICGEMHATGDNWYFGGPFGLTHLFRESDMSSLRADARKFKNVSTCLQIGWVARGYSQIIVGTLGDGVYTGSNHALLGRQIWTLKSFLVTP